MRYVAEGNKLAPNFENQLMENLLSISKIWSYAEVSLAISLVIQNVEEQDSWEKAKNRRKKEQHLTLSITDELLERLVLKCVGDLCGRSGFRSEKYLLLFSKFLCMLPFFYFFQCLLNQIRDRQN